MKISLFTDIRVNFTVIELGATLADRLYYMDWVTV